MAESNPIVRNASLCDKMKERISEINKSLGGEYEGHKSPCIFKFDQISDNDRFIPQVISIGPYYRGNLRLQRTEELKWQCLAYSLEERNKNLEDYLETIRPLEQEAKECYSESSALQTDEFLVMMVLDGCFIVEFIRFSYSILGEDKQEQSVMKRHPLARMRANVLKICADLLMLQNQIPYKVLEKVFEVSEITWEGEPLSLFTLSVKIFSAILGFHYPLNRNPPKVDWMHLLDLVWSISIASNYEGWSPGAKETSVRIQMRQQYKPFHTFPCVTELRRKGITVRPHLENRLLVNFHDGAIEMPKIILNDLMCSFLANCVTLEQLHNDRSTHFSVYVLCLDCLVNTASDVEYLRECRVIENYLKTDEEAAKFFNNLGKGLIFDWDYDDFYMLCRDVDDYCHRRLTSRCLDKPTKEKCDEMKKRISKINRSLGGESQGDKSPCIFKFDQISYSDGRRPRVVSIGPYYRGSPGLHPMEEFKWQCLAYSLNKSNKNFEYYLEKICPLEQEAKECYLESSGLQPDEFLEMILLDGCFIVEFIRFSYSIRREEKPEQSAMKSHPFARMERAKLPKICADLLMLHNQIPYKVLEKVFEVSEINLEGEPLSILSVYIFSAILGFSPFRNPPEADLVRAKAELMFRLRLVLPKAYWMHLLDLVRSIFIPSNYKGRSPRPTPPKNRYNPSDTIPCVTKLRRVGIKVNPRREDGFLVVNFHDGVIEMPKIILNDSMCSFLENCVTLEQRHDVRPKYFSVYALCLDCLVNTAADVEYLCQRRVLENYLETDEEAAKFFNHLGKGLQFDCDYFNDFFRLCRSVNDYSKNPYHRHRTSFKREYFNKPWLWISGLVAFVLLVLTFLQTFYSIYAYYVHPKN